jgi:AraC-like DNA-binding protein
MLFIPETLFEWWIDEEEPVVIYHIRFDYQLLYKDKQTWLHGPPDDTLEPLRGMIGPVRPAWIRQQFENVYALWQSYDPFSQVRIGLAFRELWLALIEDIRVMQTRSDTDEAIERTCQYMAENYQSALSVERLAAMAGFSTGYYFRQFKRLYGCSPKDYIIRLRVNKAKELIGSGGRQLSEVSRMVGYDDEFYFSRIFKRVTGMKPSLYARQSETLSSPRSSLE